MTTASESARYLLIIHALVGIAQGFYYISHPCEWQGSPGGLSNSPQAAQVAGLGYIGLGWYQLIFSYKNHVSLLAGSVPLRSFYARIVWHTEGWGYSLAFEIVGWAAAMLAGYPDYTWIPAWVKGGKREGKVKGSEKEEGKVVSG